MTVPIEDAIFVVCSLIGVALLLVTVAFDDALGGVLDALHIDAEVGGTPYMPPLLGFVLAFGVGGLVGSQVLGLRGVPALFGGLVAGVVGAVVSWAVVVLLQRNETQAPPSIRELVGRDAVVAVAIAAGRFGSVYVRAEGRMHEYSATAATDISRHTPVTVTAALGNGLVVTPIETAVPTTTLAEPSDRDA